MIEQYLVQWLQRPTLERNTNFVVQLGALLSSDRGLVRKQNQDRALAFQCPPSCGDVSGARVYILADGMGGMRDGDLCASTAVAAFAIGLLETKDQSVEAALRLASERTNRAVYEVAQGAGGSTFSALLIDRHGKGYAINCGDSRIYALDSKSGATRLTIDDNLAERVGAGGRDLVRFVGMGEGFGFDLINIAADQQRLILTSDGVHFIASETFDALARNSSSIRIFVERIAALARWCGSPDNATIIAVERENPVEPFDTPEKMILFQDAFSSIALPVVGSASKPVREPIISPAALAPPAALPLPATPAVIGGDDRAVEPRKPKKQTHKRPQNPPVQFEISADLPFNTPDPDDHR